ncbi:MAG TPA: glycosyltransferase family 4 protein [Pseudonocardiaceae bacterium]|nr:glycosyltransferase family 4 protein [Pseudonocardiaceae bacterium]
MRVYVEFPEELDVPEWSARYQRGEVPDYTPYGLHQLARAGVTVHYRAPLRSPALGWVARKVRNRLDGTEVVAEAIGMTSGQRREADVLLCMDERTGVPAALTPNAPPVVSGLAWLANPCALSRTHARFARRALHRMAAVFTQTPGLAACLARDWELPPERVHEITLGIDADFYPAQPWPVAGRTVASAGDDRLRDHATLIEAIGRLRAAGTAAHLELATTRPVDLPAELGVLHARRMGAAMRGVYQRSSVVAVALAPNKVGSGLTVVLEAMASGRPIVVTANPGMAHYVEDGVTGLLVAPGDPDALAAAIGELLADPRRAMAMGRAGRAAVEQRFTSRQMATELGDLLHRTLAS